MAYLLYTLLAVGFYNKINTMKRELRCKYNKAINPEMGVVCELREPNSLCRNCNKFKPKYPSYCCQKCGECIGYLGRFIEWVYCGLIKHECKCGKAS